MSPKHLYIGVIILAVALIGGMALHAYISSARDTAKAEQVKEDVAKQIADMRGDLRDALAAIAKQKQEVKTPQEVVRYIPQYVTLPSPPVVSNPQTLPTTTDKTEHLPDAPSSGIYFPPEDVKPLFDKLADGKACDLKLAECQKEVPLLTQRAETAERAMKGGGFWRRFKSNSKWFVIGGGIAAGAICGTGHCR